jgi:hypothetical protein
MEKVLVRIVNTKGINKKTREKLESVMEYLGEEVINRTKYYLVLNSKGEVVKVLNSSFNFINN